MMTGFPLSDPTVPAATVCAYIEDMLRELSDVAARIGERPLADSIAEAAQVANQCSAAAWAPRDRQAG